MTRWILGLQIVAIALTAILFAGRFDSGLWLGVFSILAGFAAAPLAATVGGWVLGRRRLASVADASERIVDIVGVMHTDVVRLREGTSEVPAQEVAVGILEEAVFPAVSGAVGATAEGLLGPRAGDPHVDGRCRRAHRRLRHTVDPVVALRLDRHLTRSVQSPGEAPEASRASMCALISGVWP